MDIWPRFGTLPSVLVTLAVLFFCCRPAVATEWIYVGMNEAGSEFYYDRSTLKTVEGTFIAVSVKENARGNKFVGQLAENISREEYDCEREVMRVLSINSYFRDGTSELQQGRPQWMNVPSKTTRYDLFLLVCGEGNFQFTAGEGKGKKGK